MAKIKLEIESQTEFFGFFLENALGEEVWSIINNLCSCGEVYLFSGIIRNFFLRQYPIRDIDLVIDGPIPIEEILSNIHHKKNRFGGYKLNIGGKSIDIWFLKNTWALNQQIKLDYKLEALLPETAFFNFSSIVYHFNTKKFIIGKDFIRFLGNQEIEVVYLPNLNEGLCVINSIYYATKTGFKIGPKLRKYLPLLHSRIVKLEGDYNKIQIEHFGKVIYDNDFIIKWVENLARKIS